MIFLSFQYSECRKGTQITGGVPNFCMPCTYKELSLFAQNSWELVFRDFTSPVDQLRIKLSLFALFNFKVAVYCLYVDLVCAYVCVYIYVEELRVKLGIINWILGNQSRKKIPLLLFHWSCGKVWQGEKSQAILNPGSECWLWTSSGHYEKLCGHQKSYEPKSKSKELKGQEGKENQSHCKLYKSVKEF